MAWLPDPASKHPPDTEPQPALGDLTSEAEAQTKPQVHQRITATATVQDLRPDADRELLAVYHRGYPGAEAAFTALIARHGGMVHRTCLRILGDPATAEDASQAVFVVLARRAGQIRGAVGPFLHGVAVKIAQRILGTESLRKLRERQAGEWRRAHAAAAPNSAAEDIWNEIEPLLDESIDRLPARQREALVLYYLEGLPQAAVAQRMGLDRGTVAKQIQRALLKLRQRLHRAGVLRDTGFATTSTAATSSGAPVALATMLAVQFPIGSGSGGSPAFLSLHGSALATANTAVGVAGVPPAVLTMAQGAIKMMTWMQIKSMLTAAAAVAMICVGAVAAYDRLPGDGGVEDGGEADRGAQIAPGEMKGDPPAPDKTPAPPTTPTELDAANKALAAKLETTISCDFNQTTLIEVIQALRDQAKINVAFDYSAHAETDLTIPIDLTVTDISVRNVLTTVTNMSGLAYSLERGVLILRSQNSTRETATSQNARLREQSPTLPWSEADRKTLDFMNQKPDAETVELWPTAALNLQTGMNAIVCDENTTIAVRFEDNLGRLSMPKLPEDREWVSRWEVLVEICSVQHLCWRLDNGTIVMVDRGNVSRDGCRRYNQRYPEDEKARKVLLKPISLSMQVVTLKECLKAIHESCGVSIGWDSVDLQREANEFTQTIQLAEIPARDALEFLLRGAGCSYRIENGMAIVYRPGSQPRTSPENDRVADTARWADETATIPNAGATVAPAAAPLE